MLWTNNRLAPSLDVTPTSVCVTLPIWLKSLANVRIHFMERARIVKGLRTEIRDQLVRPIHEQGWTASPGGHLRVPCVRIVMERHGLRLLDDDNCVSAMKPIRDGIADALGMYNRDQDERLVFLPPVQVKSKAYGVRVIVSVPSVAQGVH